MTAALWWLYFRAVAQRVRSLLVGSEGNRTLVARDVYTYLHVVLVAGIVVSAVGDELVIAHPAHELATAGLLLLVLVTVVASEERRAAHRGRPAV